ncbi:MAG: hypothetical protein MZV63_40485 [Marinilabiliales bacterium]|nr:hypothetical protein [Marinilabiliales bacterium]
MLSAGISLLIKPLYESEVILYPSSNITEVRTLLGEASSEAPLFGDDDATEKAAPGYPERAGKGLSEGEV